MTYKQLFYNFLKYNNVLSLYKKNIYNRLGYYKEYGLDPYNMEQTMCVSYLTAAFNWVTTNEGELFWSIINKKWYNILLSYNNNNSNKLVKIYGNHIIKLK